MAKVMVDKTREIALKVLYEIDKNGAYSNIALDEALTQARKANTKIDNKDIGFISEIVYGTVSWQLTLDEIIQKYSRIKKKKISPWILNILRMSIYQIIFLDRVPKSAAVNEGVNLAKRYGHASSSNFVNAILRKVEIKDYEDFFSIENDSERISKTTSMPPWMVELLIEQNPIDRVEEMCQAFQKKPKVWIRVNTLKTSKEDLIKELQETENESIQIQNTEKEDFLMLEKVRNLKKLKAFQEGKFTVQDEAAGKIVQVLNPQPGEKVLDSCSSPGGKTTYLAEKMENQGEIIAWDLHEHRVKLVNQAAERLGITIIQTEVKNATEYEEKYCNHFDKILLDVPCMGLGVLKRKPDIKWKRKAEDKEEITKVQRQILENCSRYLKPKGELVYATCSILKEENDAIVDQFVSQNSNFKIEEKSYLYPDDLTDGFFVCKIKKIK